MRIAIIGTGNVGSALGGSFTRAGHDVTLAGQDETKAGAVAAKLGATVAVDAVMAARGADVIVLAVPFSAAEAVAAQIADAVAGKVVIDATNPLKPDYSGLATEGESSGAERIASRLPGAKVVKAFNTLFAGLQADPAATGITPDGLLTGDDDAAKQVVAELARSIGLRPVDLGPLANAGALEAMAWLNIALQLRTGGAWNSAFVLVNAPDRAIAA